MVWLLQRFWSVLTFAKDRRSLPLKLDLDETRLFPVLVSQSSVLHWGAFKHNREARIVWDFNRMFCSGAHLLIIKRTLRKNVLKMFTVSVLHWRAFIVIKKLITNCKRLWMQTFYSGAHFNLKKGGVQVKCSGANKITWVNGQVKLFVLSLLLFWPVPQLQTRSCVTLTDEATATGSSFID